MAPTQEKPVPAAVQAPAGTAAALEGAVCPLCQAPPPEPPRFSFPPYHVRRCPACDLWYLSPRLAEEAMLGAYREESYFEGGQGPGYSSYLAQETTLRATFRRFLQTLQARGIAGERLLEVGCAYGFFLDEARGFFGWRAGTDYSRAAAARAEQVADAVYVGGLESVPAGERFDCVVLIHVIEHIYHPRALLAELARLLRPGGWIVLACPDMGGFWRPLLGRRWPFFKVPEHVTYFTASTLARLLETAGCRRIERLPYASFFTAELMGEKLGLTLPGWLRQRRFRLPATTVACAGQLTS